MTGQLCQETREIKDLWNFMLDLGLARALLYIRCVCWGMVRIGFFHYSSKGLSKKGPLNKRAFFYLFI